MRHANLFRLLFSPKPPRRGRITIIESTDKPFLIGPDLAQIMALPHFDLMNQHAKIKVPDHCVISRSARYTLDRKYDGLTVDTRTLDSKEKAECLKLVLQRLVELRKSSRSP
jgi:hypothetical protein